MNEAQVPVAPPIITAVDIIKEVDELIITLKDFYKDILDNTGDESESTTTILSCVNKLVDYVCTLKVS